MTIQAQTNLQHTFAGQPSECEGCHAEGREMDRELCTLNPPVQGFSGWWCYVCQACGYAHPYHPSLAPRGDTE